MRLSFGIKSLFVATFLIACVLALFAYQAYWLFATMCCVLAINFIGALTAILLTKFCGFPTDGGYRDPTIRAERATLDAVSSSNMSHRNDGTIQTLARDRKFSIEQSRSS